MASITKRSDGRWRARYRDPAGKELARHFTQRVDAQRWLDEVAAAVVTGMYVDPHAGKVTVASYYAEWSQRQVWESTTVLAMDLAVRSATFAALPIGSVRRSHVERWVETMTSAGLAAGTVRTRVNNVRAGPRSACGGRGTMAGPAGSVGVRWAPARRGGRDSGGRHRRPASPAAGAPSGAARAGRGGGDPSAQVRQRASGLPRRQSRRHAGRARPRPMPRR